MKIKFQQRRVTLKYSIDEKSVLLQFFATFSSKTLLLKCFLTVCNKFSDQNCLDKSVLINVSRFNHTSLMNNVVANKIRHLPQLPTLGPQIAFKREWYYFLSWLTPTPKLDFCVYAYIKDDYVCKGLLPAVYVITVIVTLIACTIISPCTYFIEFSRYESGNWFSFVSVHWFKLYQCQTKTFGVGKTISQGNNYTSLLIIKISYPWNTTVFSVLRAER